MCHTLSSRNLVKSESILFIQFQIETVLFTFLYKDRHKVESGRGIGRHVPAIYLIEMRPPGIR